MTIATLMLAVAVLAACSHDTTGPEGTKQPPPDSTHDTTSVTTTGPVSMAIVSGQNQVGHAGDTVLAKPIDVAVMRNSVSGRIVMRVVGGGAGAHPQTVVTGSPVPGAVVCNHAPDSGPALIPWSECTNSDSTGHAIMFYGMPTQTGTALGIIRGTYQNEPVVFDTAKATVLPGPAATLALGSHDLVLFTGAAASWRALITGASDHYGNAVATSGASATGDAFAVIAADSVSAPAEGTGTIDVALDSATAGVSVTALDDLSSATWTYRHACAYHNTSGQQWITTTSLTSSSATYAHPAPVTTANHLTLDVELQGTTRDSTPFGPAATHTVTLSLTVDQYPDSVVVKDVGTLPVTSTSPHTWTDGATPDCNSGFTVDSSTARTLTATS